MLEFISITAIILLAVIAPGPDFVLVTSHAISHSRTHALMASCGVAVGSLLHASYCMLGLAVLISKSLLFFSIVKLIGGSYLIYLGLKALFSKAKHTQGAPVNTHVSAAQAFYQGFINTMLNPKSIMFFIALFTIVLSENTPWFTQIGYAIEISLCDLLWLSLLAYLITHHAIKSRLNRVFSITEKLLGMLLIALGVEIFSFTLKQSS